MDLVTTLYKLNDDGEFPIGTVDSEGVIFRTSTRHGRQAVGRVHNRTVYRVTAHDERELGRVDEHGRVHSHGLFDGGPIGWIDPDGVVVRGGLIFGEEEVGRVEGPALYAGGAAILLLFLPDEDEENRRARRM